VVERRLARFMVVSRFPKRNFIFEDFLKFRARQEPVRRRKLSAVLLGLNEIFRRTVNDKKYRRFRGEGLDAPRRFGLGIFDHQINMRLFVHVVEKWKRRRKNKNAQRSDGAKRNYDPAQFLFGQFHGAAEARRCSTIVSVPCSVIRGDTPLFCRKVASISGRYGELVSTTNTAGSCSLGSGFGIDGG